MIVENLLQESMLNKLEAIFPSSKDVGVAINYLRNLRELHRVCLENEIDPDYKLILDDFENNFNHLYENIELNMTLKVHVILHHFTQYFELTNSTNSPMENLLKHYIVVFVFMKKSMASK